MRLSPSPQQYSKLSRLGSRVPLAAVLPLESDARALFQSLALEPPHVLLESARLNPVTGRYSLIAGQPSKVLIASGEEIFIRENGQERRFKGDPFHTLEAMLQAQPAVRVPGFPPFVGGAVGVIGFEAYRLLEPVKAAAQDDLGLPDLAFFFCDEAVVLDHKKKELWVIALARSYAKALEKVEYLVNRIKTPRTGGTLPHGDGEAGPGKPFALSSSKRESEVTLRQAQGDRPTSTPTAPAGLSSTHTRESFEAMVREAKELIAAGDIYQANLSQRFTASFTGDPWELYRRLTEINPSPFAAYADFGFAQLVSASPERFIRVQGDMIETRPIAGTRPKGSTAVETARLRNELILNEKERAEHLMLVDLERNDLGRVCRYDTVRVNDLMALEEYSHVIHIVSNVRGRLRPRAGFREIMAATFPGGTISGCPKLRCLEVIGQLEPVRRHYYTGSLGYISATGDLDMNLLIRTAVLHNGKAHLQAGAGIVADSDPSREYDETLHKAKALLEALAVHAEPVEA